MSDIVTNIEFNKEPIKISALGNKINVKDVELIENGTYTPDSYGADGFGQVKVNVPKAIPALEELKVTQDGVYTPSLGVAGFSKVTAEFDTSSLPKVKVSSILIGDSCIDENGYWVGFELIDTSSATSFQGRLFKNNTKVKYLDLTGFDVSNVTSLRESFQGCSSLIDLNVSNWKTTNLTSLWFTFYGCGFTSLDLSHWDTSKVVELQSCFRKCSKLKYLDISYWSGESITNTNEFFMQCGNIETLIGQRTISDVLENNIYVLRGLKKPIGYINEQTKLDRASLRAVINGLADLTGQTAQTLTLGATLMAKLTEEDIAIATNKNWTIV